VAGIIPALVFPYIFTETLDLYYFPIILVVSIAGCIIGTYTAPHTDEETLKSFYKQVRPWGFWKPIKKLVEKDDPQFKANKDFGRDMLNVVLGTVIQTGLVALPIYVVLMRKNWIFLFSGLIILLGAIMKRTWWDNLKNADK